ncbi:MAG: MBL fold metallo-hydrolase [bacterium]
MNITKLGHSCFILEINDTKILFDPGIFTDPSAVFENIKIILITHSHADHMDVSLLKKILIDNEATLITNSESANILREEGIEAQIISNGEEIELFDVKIKAIGEKHIEVYPGIDAGANTGYLINDHFFNPGDNYTIPNETVQILAMPAAGPWVKLSEAIDYALAVKPEKVFSVHDGMLINPGIIIPLATKVLSEHNIQFIDLKINQTTSL